MTEVRDQISDRLTPSRLALETRRSRRPFAIIVSFAVVAVAITGYFVANISKTALAKSQTAHFAVADATGVVAHQDQVRYKGIPVGTISGVTLHDGVPVLTVQLQSKYGRVYRDAHAQLRPNTPLMDMYLDIVDLGRAGAGTPTAARPVPASQTSNAVNVDDVLDTFRSDVRQSLAGTLDQLGNGLADRGALLRQAFVQFAPLLRTAGSISGELAARQPLVRRLVHNTAVLTGALGSRQRIMRTLVTEGNAALGTLADGRRDVAATLAQLPPTLDSINSSFAALDGVLPSVDGALTSVSPVVDELPGALENLRTLSAHAAPTVRALQPSVTKLAPLARELAPLSSNLDSAVKQLTPQTGAVDKTTRDLAICGPGLQNFFQFDMSTWKLNDYRSTMPRGNFAASARSTALLGDPNTARAKSCVNDLQVGGRPVKPSDYR
jgi:ABC-type transporter Mla subunit MlaD